MPIANIIHSTAFKVFGIALLALLLLIPLGRVVGLVDERQQRAAAAADTIAERWGAAQIVGGPVLSVPVRIRVQRDRGDETIVETVVVREFILADRLSIDGVMEPTLRRYGIYATPVYAALLRIDGEFNGDDLLAIRCDGCEPQWDQADLRLPVTDVRGIRALEEARFDGAEIRFGPDNGGVAGIAAVSAPVALADPQPQRALKFSLRLRVAGTQSLAFLPVARSSTATLAGNWPDPGFDGAFLPLQREVDAAGFQASWSVLDVNRRIAGHWRDGAAVDEVASSRFGVSLLQPVATYQQNTRAGKYGLLLIGLTFVAFFLFEVLQRWRVHPVQYLLVGSALILFYVVLLAASEHAGFALAWLAASTAVVVIVSGYAAAITRSWRIGMSVAAALSVLYGLLYFLITSEDYALLTGGAGLLVVLALVMYLTRRVDWYALVQPVR